MLFIGGALLFGLAAGFGIGRIKNPKKLSWAQAELNLLEAKVIAFGERVPAEVLAAIAVLKTKL